MPFEFKPCANCGAPVIREYNLSASRQQRRMYCGGPCEQQGRHQLAMARRKTYFWTKAKIGSEHECWEWQGFRDSNGYGRYGHILAHRVAFELSSASPGDLYVCHSCDNPACVNPAHLWLGTQNDNVQDMDGKGRRKNGAPRRGPDCNKTKLTAEQVLEIFRSSETNRALGARFGISYTAVRYIKIGRNWAHVTGASR